MRTNSPTRPTRTAATALLVVVTLLVLLVSLTAAAPADHADDAAINSASAATSTLVVDDDGADCPSAGFSRVSDAVAAASSGDTVRVCSGTYVESVTIDKPLSLVADGDATLSGNGSLATGVTVSASNVLVEGFAVRAYTETGIGTNRTARRVSNVRIIDNDIREIDPNDNVNAHRGIDLDGDSSTIRSGWTIAGNTLVDTDSYGISVGSSGFVEGVEIHSNEIRVDTQSAGMEGVLVFGPGSEPIRDVTIRDNRIETDTTAIRMANLRGSAIQGATIEGNRIRSDTEGIFLNPYCAGSNCAATQTGTQIRDNDIKAPNGIVVNVEGASLSDLRVVDGNVIDAAFDGVQLVQGTPAGEVAIHNNTFTPRVAVGVNNKNTTGVVNATGNDWGHLTGPASASDPDAPFTDPDTGALADGQGARVTEGATAGVSNVRFDPYSSANAISACGVIDTPGRYQLTGNITNSAAEACLNVTASDVVIEGNGYTIDGQLAYPSYGALVFGPPDHVSNVTVRNLTVQNRATGVGVRNATDTTVEDVEIARTHTGIALLDSAAVDLRDSSVENSTIGIDLLDSSGVEVLNNDVRDNRHGIRLRISDGNTLTANDIRSSTGNGLYLVDSEDNHVSDTVARNNDWSYYATAAAVNNTVENLSLASATVSFESRAVAVQAVPSPPASPGGVSDIGQFVRVDATPIAVSSSAAWADLNVSYTNGDVTGVNESQLLMWRYNGSNWNLVGSPNGVDTAQNVVFANATSFGVLAPLETGLVADAGTDITVDEGESISFDASGSFDEERISSYEWNFGDGATASGVQPSNTYESPGDYEVTLTVSDAAGNSDTDSVVVTVQADETVTTTIPEMTTTTDEEPPQTTTDDEPPQTTTDGEPPQQTTTSSGDGPGFGIVAALIALVSLLAVSRHR